MEKHEYVLATKYSDGHPKDHWAVGWYKQELDYRGVRYDIVDENGLSFRGNGFRRMKKICHECGTFLVENRHLIESCRFSV